MVVACRRCFDVFLVTLPSGASSEDSQDRTPDAWLRSRFVQVRVDPGFALADGRSLTSRFFSPTVHFLRDPHSNVYAFDPRLENIPLAEDFAFDRLPPYITASRDAVSPDSRNAVPNLSS
jgi:hypothetical protein